MAYYVYVPPSRRNGTLYIGVTNDLVRPRAPLPLRPELHPPLDLDRLVWFEWHGELPSAIQREKNTKHWVRRWKIELIEAHQPDLARPV